MPGSRVLGVALLLISSAALAASPPPPGGHHPTYFGGDNRAGYPPLTATTAAPKGEAQVALRLRGSPNPFTQRIQLSFGATAGATPAVRIYSAAGRLVRRLTPASAGAGGVRSVIWDGRDGRGRAVSAGVYFARVETGRGVETLRIARLR